MHRLRAQLDVLGGEPRHDGRRRIEAHGLLQHRARHGKPLEVLGADGVRADDGVDLGRGCAPATAARGRGDRASRSAPWRSSRGRRQGRSRDCRRAASPTSASPVSGSCARARRASRSSPSRPVARRRARIGRHGGPQRPRRPAALELARVPHPRAEGAASPRRCPRRWWPAPCRRTCRMAAASASALPANIVAEMTWNVVSVMSRSIGCTGPSRAAAPARHLVLGRRRHGRHQAGEDRPGGTAAPRCGAASASWRPPRSGCPRPACAANTRFSSGVLVNCALACSSTFSISAGSVTQATMLRPLSWTTIGSS